MLLTDAVQYLAQALYVGLFGVTLVQAVRRPTRASFEIALFFGTAALVVALGVLGAVLHIAQATPFIVLTVARSLSSMVDP